MINNNNTNRNPANIIQIYSSCSCGINSRLFIEIVNFQSGIVCQHNSIPCFFRYCPCLNQSIFLIACAIFLHVRRNSRFLHGKYLSPKIRQYFSDFPHFTGISGCENNSLLHVSRFLPASRLCAMSFHAANLFSALLPGFPKSCINGICDFLLLFLFGKLFFFARV